MEAVYIDNLSSSHDVKIKLPYDKYDARQYQLTTVNSVKYCQSYT